jgi:hypothetical protein
MKETVEIVEIQKTVDKVVQFIEQNSYIKVPFLDFLGVYIMGESWDWLEKGDKVILIKYYENPYDHFILNKLGGEVRLKHINRDVFPVILIPENLKFYLGGVK